MSQPHPTLISLLNKCDASTRVIAYAVPTRILRILQIDEAGLTFRVEQLVEHGGFGTPEPKGEWKTISSHTGTGAGEALGVAFEALWKAQQDLIYKLRKKMIQRMPPPPARPNGAA